MASSPAILKHAIGSKPDIRSMSALGGKRTLRLVRRTFAPTLCGFRVDPASRKLWERQALSFVRLHMPRYFFDTRDGERFFRDEIGDELPDIHSAVKEASRFLGELARDVLPGSMKRVLTVEVRDGLRRVLEARLTFEAVVLV